MNTTGTIIAGGVQLDERVPMPDQSRVRVAIEGIDSASVDFTEGLEAWKQLCEEHPIHAGGRRYTRDELYERD